MYFAVFVLAIIVLCSAIANAIYFVGSGRSLSLGMAVFFALAGAFGLWATRFLTNERK